MAGHAQLTTTATYHSDLRERGRRGGAEHPRAHVVGLDSILPVTRPQVRRRRGLTPDLQCVTASPQTKIASASANVPAQPTSLTEPEPSTVIQVSSPSLAI